MLTCRDSLDIPHAPARPRRLYLTAQTATSVGKEVPLCDDCAAEPQLWKRGQGEGGEVFVPAEPPKARLN
jgi:hypothetical protein